MCVCECHWWERLCVCVNVTGGRGSVCVWMCVCMSLVGEVVCVCVCVWSLEKGVFVLECVTVFLFCVS